MFNIRKHWLFKAECPNPKDYIGRSVQVMGTNGLPRVVEIERIVGNLTHPTKYEITSEGRQYLISMLDFHAQMNGERVTQAEIDEFDETTMVAIQDLRGKRKDKLWIPPHLRRIKH